MADKSSTVEQSSSATIEKVVSSTNCSEVVSLLDDNGTVTSMQQQITDLQNANSTEASQISSLQSQASTLQTQVTNLNNNNTTNADFLKSHPVGTVYITNNSTNPGSIYGGSWSAYAQGRVLVGVGGTSGTNGTNMTFSAGQYGGEFTHRLTVAEMPSHNHSLNGYTWFWGTTFSSNVYADSANATAGATPNNYLSTSQNYYDWTNSNGGDQYHNNIQPYVAVYIWLRTA